MVFTLHGNELESVPTFRYLDGPFSVFDDDWPAVHRNLQRARRRRGQIYRVLVREGKFYKAIVMAVLLYGCESLVATDSILKVLQGFYHQVARPLTGTTPFFDRRSQEWKYPPIEKSWGKAELFPLEHYVRKPQSRLAEQVALLPLLTLCRDHERMSGSPERSYWWDQEFGT